MDNKIERKAISGDVRILIQISPERGWQISQDTYNIEIPVLTLSPLGAKFIIAELTRITEFYRSDYYLWGQRKANKRTGLPNL
jgi:hypothetical protein